MYDVAKNNIILCIWCNAMCLRDSRLKKVIVLRSEVCCDWPTIQCIVIGWILAEYLKPVTEMLRPLPFWDAVSQRDETKTIKPTVN